MLGCLATKIVGIQHYGKEVRQGERVCFQRDPKNFHDKNAIEVHNSKGEMAGYLPREDAALLAPLMDQDKIFMVGTAGLPEEPWFIPINISLTQKGEATLSPDEQADRIAYQKVLALFNEWRRGSGRSHLEIIEACEKFFNHATCPETFLLMRLMGVTEGEEIYEDFCDKEPEMSLSDIMSELENRPEYLSFLEENRVDSEEDEFAMTLEKFQYIQKYGDDKQRFLLRIIINQLMKEILSKRE